MADAKIRYARTSDGADIAYATAGDGPALLIARAILRLAIDDELAPDSDATWLMTLMEHRSVVIWDPRGFGLSAGSEPQYTLESSVRDVEAVVDALQVDRLDLLGHLSPAHTALAYAARHPERVRRLALWNPSPPGASMRRAALAGLPVIEQTHFHEYLQLAALRTFGWDRGRAAKRWVEHASRQFTAESWDRVMSELEQLDSTPELSNVASPALIIEDTSPTEGGRRTQDQSRFGKKLVTVLSNAELATIKPGSQQTYATIVEQFLATRAEPADATPSGTAIILFADIADSTALTERMGDAAFREKARALDDALRIAVRDNGGSVIDAKTLGDGILATFPAASQAIAAALACGSAGDAQGLPLHLGLHAGDVIREADNVFGGAVNIAARISALAAPGEVLVSRTVADLARTSAGVTFEDRGEHTLKGIAEPQRVFAVQAG